MTGLLLLCLVVEAPGVACCSLGMGQPSQPNNTLQSPESEFTYRGPECLCPLCTQLQDRIV